MVKVGLIAGIVNLVFTLLINWVVGFILPTVAAEYQNSDIFRPWSDPRMLVYFAHPFILGIVLAYLWKHLGNGLNGSNNQKALGFAKTYFIIATIPGMFITYTSFQLSLTIVALWTIMGFAQAYLAGFVFAKMNWEK